MEGQGQGQGLTYSESSQRWSPSDPERSPHLSSQTFLSYHSLVRRSRFGVRMGASHKSPTVLGGVSRVPRPPAGSTLKLAKHYSTRDSQVIPQPTTSLAQLSLTSEFWWDRVFSQWYDRSIVVSQNCSLYTTQSQEGGKRNAETPTDFRWVTARLGCSGVPTQASPRTQGTLRRPRYLRTARARQSMT